MDATTWAGIADAVLVTLAIYLSYTTNIIRDVSCQQDGRKPYSLARTQLMWWTVIVIGCFIYYIITEKVIPDIGSTALMLLGISAATTASGAIIDGTDMKVEKAAANLAAGTPGKTGWERHQNKPAVQFFADLLSDAQGASVHRFQCLIFNVVVGLMYIYMFHHSDPMAFPDFSNDYIMPLLGISSAGYIALKAGENKPEVLKTVNENDSGGNNDPKGGDDGKGGAKDGVAEKKN